MTAGQYLIASGTYNTEDDIIAELAYHAEQDFGWTVPPIDGIYPTATDRSFFSEGEEPGKYMPLYTRADSVTSADHISFFGYTFFDSSDGTGTDEIADSTELRVPTTNGTGEWLFVGNKDVIYTIVRPTSTSVDSFGGFGYLGTNFDSSQDPYPLFVAGQNSTSDTFENTSRVFSYMFAPAGFLVPTNITPGSGTIASLRADNLQFLVANSAPSPRDSRYAMFPPLFRRPLSFSSGHIASEVRGELSGVYQVAGIGFAPGNIVSVSGTFGNGNFLIVKSSTSLSFAIGPVTTVSG